MENSQKNPQQISPKPELQTSSQAPTQDKFQPTPQKPEKSPKNSLYVPILVALLAFVAILGIIFYFQLSGTKNLVSALRQAGLIQKVQPSAKPQPSASPTPLPETIDTSNWSTYADPDGRFTFRYPPGLAIQNQAESLSQISGQLLVHSGKTIDQNTYPPCPDPTSSSDNICVIPGRHWGQAADFDTVLFADKQATSFYLYMGKTPNYILRIIQLNEPELELAFAVDGFGLNETFNTILSTLEFTDPNNASSYQISDLDISFQNPQSFNIFTKGSDTSTQVTISNPQNPNLIMTISYFKKTFGLGGSDSTYEDILINSQPLTLFGQQVQRIISNNENDRPQYSAIVILPEESTHNIGIDYQYQNPPKPEEFAPFDQILSTFKFINN